MTTTYQHASAGTLIAVPVADYQAPSPGFRVPAMADWVVTVDGHAEPVLGYITDERAVFSLPASETLPEDEDEKPFEAYDKRGRYITCARSVRGALLAVGNRS
jgi:hypothetical protein